MSKTYAVITMERRPGQRAIEKVAHRDLSAREAARAAVKAAREVQDTAYVVPMGGRIDNVQMMCSMSIRPRRSGARVQRGFVQCTPMPKFKPLLKAPKKKARRKSR